MSRKKRNCFWKPLRNSKRKIFILSKPYSNLPNRKSRNFNKKSKNYKEKTWTSKTKSRNCNSSSNSNIKIISQSKRTTKKDSSKRKKNRNTSKRHKCSMFLNSKKLSFWKEIYISRKNNWIKGRKNSNWNGKKSMKRNKKLWQGRKWLNKNKRKTMNKS